MYGLDVVITKTNFIIININWGAESYVSGQGALQYCLLDCSWNVQ